MAKRKKRVMVNKVSLWERLKAKVSRHRSAAIAVAAIGICVVALAIFVPSNPKAMEESTESADSIVGVAVGAQGSTCKADSLGSQRFGTGITGPASVTVDRVATYKITLCDPYPKKAAVKNVHFALQTGGATIVSSSVGYSKIRVPGSGTAPAIGWNLGTFGSGASKTITLKLKYQSTGSKTLIVTVWDGLVHVDGARSRDIIVKQPSMLPPPPASWHGTGCITYSQVGVVHIACNYPGSPFLLSGYSKGGSSTLSYVIQCEKYTGVPVSPVVIYPKVWYSHSQSITNNFNVYGLKGVVAAAKNCVPNQDRAPVLTVTLMSGAANPQISLHMKLDGTLPWGKTPKAKPKPMYGLKASIYCPSTVVADGSTYVCKLPVQNIGKLKISRAKLHFSPIALKVGSSIHWSSAGNYTLSNLRTGKKRTITVRIDPQRSTETSLKLKFSAQGLGTAKKAKSSASTTVKVEVPDETQTTTTTG